MPFPSSSEFEIAHWNHDIRLIPNQISPFLLSFFVLVPFGWGEEQLLPEWTESLLHPFPGAVVNRRRVGGRWEEKDFRTFLNLKQDQFLIAETVYICQNAVTRVFQSTYHCQVQQKVFCGRSLEVGPTLVQTWESQVIPVHWEIVKKHSEQSLNVLCWPSSAGIRLEMTRAAGCRSTWRIEISERQLLKMETLCQNSLKWRDRGM